MDTKIDTRVRRCSKDKRSKMPVQNTLNLHEDAEVRLGEAVISSERLLPFPDHSLAVPCTVYAPKELMGRRSGLIVHLYGSGGSHTSHNLKRVAYLPLLHYLREAGYWIVVPELGPSHWMNAEAIDIVDAVISSMITHGVDPRRVHFLGTSMGGGSSLIYAKARPERVRSVCALFPMTDLEAWISEMPAYRLPIMQAHALTDLNLMVALKSLSPLNHAFGFSKTPIYILHGSADTIVPVHHGRDFADAVRQTGGSVIYHEIAGGDHSDDIAAGRHGDIFDFFTGAELN